MIVIDGKPIPKKRPRFTKHGHVYDCQAKEKYDMQYVIKSKWTKEPIKNPLGIKIVFWMPIPKSWSKKKKDCIGFPHHKRPDIDNLEKFILDCMNGIVYEDDCLIADLHSTKKYGVQPKTVIFINELSKTNMFFDE